MTKPTVEETWRQLLTGDMRRLQNMRRMWGALPSAPRCKLLQTLRSAGRAGF